MVPLEKRTCWILGDIAGETAPHFVATQNCLYRTEEPNEYSILGRNKHVCSHPDMAARKPLRSFCPGAQATAIVLQGQSEATSET